MTPEQWLKENDRRLWLERVKVSVAKKQCEEETGERIKTYQWKKLRQRGWSNIRVWIENHYEALKGESDEFRIAYMRAHGMPSNQSILDGCATLKQLDREHEKTEVAV